LSYANVMSTLAVFIALGGASYAAVKLPKNSVGTSQIRENAVTGSKVKSGSLTGSDVRNSSLTGSDIRDRSLTAADFDGSVQGAKGLQGAKGDPGPRGDAGPPGPITGAVDGNVQTPPASPSSAAGTALITTPGRGRLLVLGRFDSASWQCLSFGGACTLAVGIYVDGVPVPQTLATANLGAGSSLTAFGAYNRFGVSAAVDAGTHLVTISSRTTTGVSAAGLESPTNVSVGAVLIGG